MKCSVCQAEFQDFSSICPKCGADLQSNPYQAPKATFAQPAANSNEGDATGGMIPYKNPKALIAYYLGIFSFIPFLGLFIGGAAFILGILGLRDRKRNPAIKGSIHAGIGIGCGGFFALVWALAIISMIFVFMSEVRR